MWYIYRYMIGDQWIYVGKSANALLSRLTSHKYEQKFEPYSNATIEYFVCSSASDMNLLEKLFIKTMHPVLNELDSTDGVIPFVYDDSLIEWINIDQYQERPEGKSEIQVSLASVVEWFKNLKSNNEFIIYSGPIYGTYKVPFKKICSALNLPDGVKISSLEVELQNIFKAHRLDFGAEIVCNTDPGQKMFYFYEYR